MDDAWGCCLPAAWSTLPMLPADLTAAGVRGLMLELPPRGLSWSAGLSDALAAGMICVGLKIAARTALDADIVATCDHVAARWAPGGGYIALEPPPRAMPVQHWHERLQAWAEQARIRGFHLTVANRLGSVVEQLEDVRELLARMRGVGLAVDVGEAHAAAVNPRHLLAEFDHRVVMLLLGDRRGRRRVPIGAGEINLSRLLEDAGRRAGLWRMVSVRDPAAPQTLWDDLQAARRIASQVPAADESE